MRSKRTRCIAIGLSAAVFTVVLFAIGLLVLERALKAYRPYLLALDDAGLTGEDVGRIAERVTQNRAVLETAIDTLIVERNGKTEIATENISYESCDGVLLLAADIARAVPAEKLARFVKHTGVGAKDGAASVALAARYYSKQLRKIELPQNLDKLTAAMNTEDGTSPQIKADSNAALIKVLLSVSVQYADMELKFRQRTLGTVEELLNGGEPTVRQVLSLVRTAAVGIGTVSGGELAAFCSRFGKDDVIGALSVAPASVKNICSIVAATDDATLLSFFFDLPDTDAVAQTLLDTFYAAEFYGQNRTGIEAELDQLTGRLQAIYPQFQGKTLVHILADALAAVFHEGGFGL